MLRFLARAAALALLLAAPACAQTTPTSGLPAASAANGTDLLAASQVCTGTTTGYCSRKLSLSQVLSYTGGGGTVGDGSVTAAKLAAGAAAGNLGLTPSDDAALYDAGSKNYTVESSGTHVNAFVADGTYTGPPFKASGTISTNAFVCNTTGGQACFLFNGSYSAETINSLDTSPVFIHAAGHHNVVLDTSSDSSTTPILMSDNQAVCFVAYTWCVKHNSATGRITFLNGSNSPIFSVDGNGNAYFAGTVTPSTAP